MHCTAIFGECQGLATGLMGAGGRKFQAVWNVLTESPLAGADVPRGKSCAGQGKAGAVQRDSVPSDTPA